MASVSLVGIGKLFPGGVHAVRDVSLEIADGEFVVLVGPSGCGKSTTLRIIAGLESASSGSVRIGGKEVDALPVKDRDLAVVFQNYALYPHMSVRENLAFGLRLHGVDKAEIDRRIATVTAMLEMDGLLERKPRALSGGQQQRVALGRALVRQPAAFLLDEPLSNLDARLRAQTRVELKRLHERLTATFIYVTHDQVEAMTMGDRIVVMDGGRVQQVGAPMAVYQRPANRFVATFLGSPPMNLLPGQVAGGMFTAAGGAPILPCPLADGAVELGVRPEDLRPDPAGPISGTVEGVEPLGADLLVHLRCGTHLLVARLDGRAEVRPGAQLSLGIAPGLIHAFDPASGVARASRPC